MSCSCAGRGPLRLRQCFSTGRARDDPVLCCFPTDCLGSRHISESGRGRDTFSKYFLSRALAVFLMAERDPAWSPPGMAAQLLWLWPGPSVDCRRNFISIKRLAGWMVQPVALGSLKGLRAGRGLLLIAPLFPLPARQGRSND